MTSRVTSRQATKWLETRSFLAALLLLCPFTAAAETVRIATWNIENFWHVEGESLRGPYKGRDQIRYAEDYAALRQVIARIDADVWGLQEMGSPESVRALFPEDTWTLVFSTRYDPSNPRDIYTALAIRTDAAQVLETNQIPLSVSGTNREGTAARLSLRGEEVWVASVHLKSGCRNDDPDTSSRRQCETLADQLPILETWIDERLATGVLVMGDFNRHLMGETRAIQGQDPVWQDLADDTPERLFAFPFAPQVNCPEGRYGARTWPVEFILTNADWALSSQPGPYMQDMGGAGLSDHCPVMVEFDR